MPRLEHGIDGLLTGGGGRTVVKAGHFGPTFELLHAERKDASQY